MMEPNLIIKISPTGDGGFDWEIVTNETAHDFESMFRFENEDLAQAIEDANLTKIRRPYLLNFTGAAIGKEEEYSFDEPTGHCFDTFEYKSVKVGKV